MTHQPSSDDHAFRLAFEEGRVGPDTFNHRAHVRLAYTYLADHDTETAAGLMRSALHGFIQHWGIPPEKFHETLTRAWVLAVRHFMAQSTGADSADDFIARNPALLDSKIMLTHYSAALLFSPEARATFVEPDTSPIPRHPEPRAMKRPLRELSNAALLVLGIVCAGMGLKGFLLSSNFIDGGVTGVSMLLSKTTGWPLALLLPLVNLPFVAIGWHQIGLAFAVRSICGITGLALALVFIPYPDVTPDLVLTAVFGGFFLGAGIGLAIRGGAVLDGTEIAALLISKRSSLFKVGDVILAFNVVLFTVAVSILGVQAALYSILTYIAASKTLDFVLHGIDEFTAITIVSDENVAIRERLTGELARGVTVYRGYGGKTGADRDILYCVVTRLEIGRVKAIARDINPSAFVVFHPLAGAEGGTVRRRTII